MKKIWMRVLVLALLFGCTQVAMAQLPTIPQVSSINIDALSDAQFQAYLQQAQLSGLSEAELEAKAKERGLSAAQIAQIKARMGSLGAGTGTEKKTSVATYEPRKAVTVKNEFTAPAGPAIFGSEFFSNSNLTFEPNMRMATPSNYVLGVDDELSIDIYGFSEKTSKYKINTEGQIRIPNIGPVTLAGLTIEEAKTKLKGVLSKTYPGLQSGNTFLQVSLGQIRSIRVTLIGEVNKPGSYELSSLSTLANALYASGGPSANGSFRKIDLMRNGKRLVTFDLYDFLLNGDLSKNILLKDDDIIKVHPYAVRLTLTGAVKKAAQLKENAFVGRALLFRTNATKDTTVTAVNLTAMADLSIALRNDDSLHVYSKMELKEPATVTITGELNKPGTFAYAAGMKLEDIVLLGGGLNDRASYKEVEVLRRLRKDATMADTVVYNTILKFNLQDSLTFTASQAAIELEPYDVVNVKNVPRNQSAGSVSIAGEVLFPGTYLLNTKKDRVSDLFKRSGGILESGSLGSAFFLRNTYQAALKGEILDIKKALAQKQNSDTATIKLLDSTLSKEKILMAVNLSNALENPGSADDIVLEEGDMITIPKKPVAVQAFGAVNIQKKVPFYNGLTARRLIKESGGFAENANRGGTYVLYPNGRVKTSHNYIFWRTYPKLTAGAEVYVPIKKYRKPLTAGEIMSFTSGLVGMGALILGIINATK